MAWRLRSEDGVALTVAIFTLAVIALFSALVATTAGHLSNTSNESRDAKRALAVANTAVATALHHLNTMDDPPEFDPDNPAPPDLPELGNLKCLAADVQFDPYAEATVDGFIEHREGHPVHHQGGYCPGVEGRAGNDGEWKYYVTLLNNGQRCDEAYDTQAEVEGLLAIGTGNISVLRRCIFAVGKVNGVQRRVQQEVFADFRLFHGLIGLDGVTVKEGANLGESHVGSNSKVTMDDTTLFNGQVEVKNKDDAAIQATGVYAIKERHEPWIADPVELGSGEFNKPDGVTCALLCSPWEGDPAARRISVDALETITFESGDYRLCEFNLNGGTVEIVGTVSLWIDDCGPNAGAGLVLSGGGLLNAVSGAVPSSLRIYVDGNRPVQIGGGIATTANLTLYAPLSVVTVGGGAVAPIVKGSITAKTITVGGGTSFVADPLLDIVSPFAQIAGKWHPGDWSECQPYPPDANDSLSGCND